jgi:hypothetical protein
MSVREMAKRLEVSPSMIYAPREQVARRTPEWASGGGDPHRRGTPRRKPGIQPGGLPVVHDGSSVARQATVSRECDTALPQTRPAKHGYGTDKEISLRRFMNYIVDHFTDPEFDERDLFNVAFTRIPGAINLDGGGM